MAVEFIGGTIPSAVIEVLGEKLTIPEILGFFKSHKPSDDLLGKLKETLNTLNGLLSDGLLGKIIKDILDKINASTCRTKEPDESLMEAMKGEKLLLVLDDAWNIKYNEWDKLLLPLRNVEHGRKIVVTTRGTLSLSSNGRRYIKLLKKGVYHFVWLSIRFCYATM
ncbi:hypothetical protein NC653_037327 [Populus alba x Populus x berolinensis]|uniref:NB-ARC domain-containing protein n=1 Tax=Populus alba x Populus x berolinensis TaxID=444605 RepID=A0AAD6LER1_9ROSI|nr:hypothetical protein NC653_037327 [Populus alba x Populus x berolinensis]